MSSIVENIFWQRGKNNITRKKEFRSQGGTKCQKRDLDPIQEESYIKCVCLYLCEYSVCIMLTHSELHTWLNNCVCVCVCQSVCLCVCGMKRERNRGEEKGGAANKNGRDQSGNSRLDSSVQCGFKDKSARRVFQLSERI